MKIITIESQNLTEWKAAALAAELNYLHLPFLVFYSAWPYWKVNNSSKNFHSKMNTYIRINALLGGRRTLHLSRSHQFTLSSYFWCRMVKIVTECEYEWSFSAIHDWTNHTLIINSRGQRETTVDLGHRVLQNAQHKNATKPDSCYWASVWRFSSYQF